MPRATSATFERSADPSLPLGGVHGYEDHLRLPDEPCQATGIGEREPLLLEASGDQLFEARLVERHPACLQRAYAPLVTVDAHDPVAKVREASPRHQPNVAGSDDPYPKALRQVSSPDICALQDRCLSILTTQSETDLGLFAAYCAKGGPRIPQMSSLRLLNRYEQATDYNLSLFTLIMQPIRLSESPFTWCEPHFPDSTHSQLLTFR